MAQPQPAAPSPTWATELSEFIYTSVQREYGLGVDEFIAVQRLLVELAARDAVPSDADSLTAMLSPILCTTREEQAALPSKFKSWLGAFEEGRAPERRSEPEPEPPPRGTFQRTLRWYRILTVLGTLAALVGGVVVYQATGLPDDPTPVGPASARGTQVQAEWAQDDALARTPDGPSPEVPAPISTPTDEVRRGAEPPETTPMRAAPPRPPAPAGTPRRSTTALWFFFGGLLLLLWLLRRLFLWWQGQRFLNRSMSDDTDMDVRRVVLRASAPSASRESARAAKLLRARQLARTEVLDVQGSVRATARSGGVPQLVFRKRTELPEYLCLVERRSAKDHVAALAERQIEQVCAHGVFMKQLHFHTDPQVCFEAGGEGRIMSLSEVESLYAGHRLLLVADGAGLMDSQSGAPAPYLEDLSVFRSVSLLTPEPKESWGRREQMLRESGVPVLPLSAQGLSDVRQETKKTRGFVSGSAPPFPPTFERDARLWLHDDEPDEDMISSGLRDLRRYLGEGGFLWLGACAVYPELRPELTHELGQLLKEKSLGEDFGPETELRLSRLPWFRHGRLPDWLRLRLLRSIPESREAELRSSMQRLFLSSLDPTVMGRATLEIAVDERQFVGSLWRRLSRTLGKQKGGPWSDRVFLGWTGNRLSFRVPSRLARSFSDSLATIREPLTASRTAASGALIVFALSLIETTDGSWTLRAFPLYLSALPYFRHYLNRKEARPARRVCIDLLAMYWILLALTDVTSVTPLSVFLLPLCALLPALAQGIISAVLAAVRMRFRLPFVLSETPWLLLCGVLAWPLLDLVRTAPSWSYLTQLEEFQTKLSAQLMLLVPILRLVAKWPRAEGLVRVMDFLSPGRWLLGPARTPQRPPRVTGAWDVLLSSWLSAGLSSPFLVTALLGRSKRDLSLSPVYFLAAAAGLTCWGLGVVADSGQPLNPLEWWTTWWDTRLHERVLLFVPLAYLVFELARRSLRQAPGSTARQGRERARDAETTPAWVESVLDALSPTRLWRQGPRGTLFALAIPLIYPPTWDLTHHLAGKAQDWVDAAFGVPADPESAHLPSPVEPGGKAALEQKRPDEAPADGAEPASADGAEPAPVDGAEPEKTGELTQEPKEVQLSQARGSWPSIYQAISAGLTNCNLRLTAPGKKPAFSFRLDYRSGAPRLDHSAGVPRAVEQCIEGQVTTAPEVTERVQAGRGTIFVVDVSYLPTVSQVGLKAAKGAAGKPGSAAAKPSGCAPGDPMCGEIEAQSAPYPPYEQKAPPYPNSNATAD